MKKIAIFDIDGTISDGTHRLHLMPKADHHLTESWFDFNMACIDDKPIKSTIAVLNAIRFSGHPVILLSGRSTHAYIETLQWLDEHGVKYDGLIMRDFRDNRKDTIIKEEALCDLGLDNIMACWDDNPNVISHLRGLGLTVYDVAGYSDAERHDLKSHGVEKL